MRAREESKNGYVQHVNVDPERGPYISDWFDSDETVASYEGGRPVGVSAGEMEESAPPGEEALVKDLKKEYPGHEDKAFATAWSIYNKKHGKAEEGCSMGMEEEGNDPRTDPRWVQEALAEFESLVMNSYVEPERAYDKVVSDLQANGHNQSVIDAFRAALMQHGEDQQAQAQAEFPVMEEEGLNEDWKIEKIKGLIYNQGVKDGAIAAETGNPQMNMDAALELWFAFQGQEGNDYYDDRVSDEMEAAYKAGFGDGFGGVEEDFNNGYDDRNVARGSDYFPNGADGPVVKATGPSGARQGDNPEQKKMQVAETHKELVYAYRAFLKESAPTQKKRLTESAQVADVKFENYGDGPEASSDSINFDGVMAVNATVINRQGVAAQVGLEVIVSAESGLDWESDERDVAGLAGPESDTYETYYYAVPGEIKVTQLEFDNGENWTYDGSDVTKEQMLQFVDPEVLKQILNPQLVAKALEPEFSAAAEDIPEPEPQFNEPDPYDYDDRY
jgi:hypothetical protein